MKPIRFYIAMFASRSSYYLLKMLQRNASHFPGVVAQKIYPNMLQFLEAPNKIVAITGTNGKTTTTNMVIEFLESKNVDFIGNTYGSNIEAGIISTLLRSTSFFGKNKKELAVLEVDERASLRIFPFLQPDIIVITNLYTDSYKRNAHIEYIVETLEKSITKSSHLLLNADDVISNNISKDNSRSYFSIKPQQFEEEVTDSIIIDAPYCPVCEGVLTYDFKRYHHIGFVHCDTCGYKTPAVDYELSDILDDELIIIENSQAYTYKNEIKNIIDNYNKLTAISTLREIGYSHEEIIEYFDNKPTKIIETRYNESIVNGKRIVSIFAKEQNPVANSRVFDFLRKQKNWGTMTLIFKNEEEGHTTNFKEVENMSYYYGADFEYLVDANIKSIYCLGNRNLDMKTRLVLAGIDESIIKLLPPSDTMDIDIKTDSVILLHDIKNVPEEKIFREHLEKEARK